MGQWLVCRSSLCLFYSNETSGAGEQSCLQRKKRLLGLRVCKGCHRQNRAECGCTPVCMRTFYLALTLPWHGLIAILCEIRFVFIRENNNSEIFRTRERLFKGKRERIFSQSREPTDVGATVCAFTCKTIVSSLQINAFNRSDSLVSVYLKCVICFLYKTQHFPLNLYLFVLSLHIFVCIYYNDMKSVLFFAKF